MTANKVRFLLTQKEKFDKDGNPSDLLKNIFNYYESNGYQQVYAKDQKYRKLYNLAHGKINKEDYMTEEIPTELEFDLQDSKLDDVGLNFYPIIPNIRNAILGEYDKKYIKYSARAVNPENTNDIIESMDKDLVQSMVKRLEEMFISENPNVTEEQYKAFQESEEIKKTYQTKYRTTIERWANHTVKKEDARFDMKTIERNILDQLIITEDPVVHVNYMNDNYYPEVWNEKNCFYLKSTESDCYSESLMFGNFDYINIGSILNKYGDLLTANQVSEIESWISKYYSNTFTINGHYDDFTGNRNQDQDSIQNYLTFKNLDNNGRYDTYDQDLFRETTIYFLLPRKVGKLTYKSGSTIFKDLVDETYKPTIKAIYEKGYAKNEHSLIEGEHIEWFYVNELYRGKKLSFNTNSHNYSSSTPNQNDIWIELKKHDIQYSDSKFKYGISIPVYGGSVSNRYNESFSIVDKCSSWQIFYNWMWNRNAQLAATEVGRFFAFNQAAIPDESMGETWGKNNLFKWAITGRDIGLAPLDTSLSAMGQSAMGIHGGLGQMVDLNRTSDILEKANLANVVKQECYNLVGLTPEFIFGNISGQQTATSVMQGIQRSSNQIQHLYTRLHQILRRLRSGMLETAQYIESNNPYSQISYLSDNGVRTIFSTSTEGFLLHKLDIYIESSLSDLDALEKIKMHTLQSNTLGADSLEMASIQVATSTSELMDKLRNLKYEKEKEQQRLAQMEQEKQNQMLQSNQQMQQESLQAKALENEKDRKNRLDVAVIKSLGDADDDAMLVSSEIKDMLKYRQADNKFQQEMELKNKLADMKKIQMEQSFYKDEGKRNLEEKIRLKQLEQKDQELEIKRQDIKARNIRSEAID